MDLFRRKKPTTATPHPRPGTVPDDPRQRQEAAGTTDEQQVAPQGGDRTDSAVGSADLVDRAPGDRRPSEDVTPAGQGGVSAGSATDHHRQAAHTPSHEAGTGGTPESRDGESDVSGARELSEHPAVSNLVGLLLARGADRAHLTLVQSGNIMTHQTRQAVGEAQDEVQNGTVDQDSPLFDDVADLYTEHMNSPAGPWRQADLVVSSQRDGVREVNAEFSYPDGSRHTERYVSGHPASQTGEGMAADDLRSPTEQEARDDASVRGATDHDLPGGDPAHEPSGVDEHPEIVTRDLDERAGDGQERSGEAGAAALTTAGLAAQYPSEHRTVIGDGEGSEDSGEPSQRGPLEASEDQHHLEDDQFAADQPSAHGQDETLAGDDSQLHGVRDETDERTGHGELPEHLDEDEFSADHEPTVAPVTPEEADPAPAVATSTDVAPSYREPEAQPEGESLAEGNLVLTVADVTSRLAEAQDHLFAPHGSAHDVSTVLIRVRALGTYYDALTHVRLNGFWDQRPTFDLVPEELLRVQEFKDDSYLEGYGAPLAMMFRFRPGVPPEVTFDYSDEEAFVRYEQRLPGQNYLEELRMYPRTGSNIPQHMNEALQDWNY